MNTARSLALVASAFLALTATAAESGFRPIFDGKTLDGWEGNPELWSVEDGAITGRTKAETNLKHNTFLVWKGGTVADFELRLSYRIVNGNSGIQYRSKVVEKGPQGPIVAGYQADFEAGKTYSGILYEERGRGILAERGQVTRLVSAEGGKHRVEVLASVGKTEELQANIKSEDWNDYIVIARGNHLTHIINGRVTADVTDDDAANAARNGVLALQVHQGPPMTVQFRNVRLKDFAAAGVAVNDTDAIQGQWVAKSISRDGQEVPAEIIKTIRLKIAGDRYDVVLPDTEDTGRLVLRSSTTPKQMDIFSGQGATVLGIYSVEGNTMKVSYSPEGDRPTGFGGGPGQVSVTYVRP